MDFIFRIISKFLFIYSSNQTLVLKVPHLSLTYVTISYANSYKSDH